MEILAERLDAKLREWRPDIAGSVRRHEAEIIHLADQDALDILRSRTVEQWIFWMNPQPGEVWMPDLGLAAKLRSVVIVSRDDPDPPWALII